MPVKVSKILSNKALEDIQGTIETLSLLSAGLSQGAAREDLAASALITRAMRSIIIGLDTRLRDANNLLES